MSMDELKSMDYDDLRQHNHLKQRTTDRYWREIYRRNNKDQLPDTINLNHLTKKNAITTLDERLPRGGLHGNEEFRIVAGRRDSSDGDALQDHVIKYLRRRYLSNYEIITDDDGTIRIAHSKK
uniref:Uncharacterized protein n=1 Tax=Plectus sambesii TaxID=2011161 RepID=A0A914XAG2_9BILA